MRRVAGSGVAWIAVVVLALAGCGGGSAPEIDDGTPGPATVEPLESAEPTPAPTEEPSPTPAPKPTPRLAANDKISYTSSTSVGRLIELTLTVRNVGTLSAGKVSAQVEGKGYSIKSRTPIVGCVPDCHAATGSEGIIYVEWKAPAPGKRQAYTVQLKAKKAGTYTILVRAYRGPAEDPVDQLASWTVKTRVK